VLPGDKVRLTFDNGYTAVVEVEGLHGTVAVLRPNGQTVERNTGNAYLLWAEVGFEPIIARGATGRARLPYIVTAIEFLP